MERKAEMQSHVGKRLVDLTDAHVRCDAQSTSATDVGSTSSGTSVNLLGRIAAFSPKIAAFSPRLAAFSPSLQRHVSFAFAPDSNYIALQDDVTTPSLLCKSKSLPEVCRGLSEWWRPVHKKKVPPSLWRRYGLPALAVLAYYVIGYFFYTLHRGWSILDGIYFSTVLMMTVGYGDEVPHGDFALLFTALYALLAVTLVAAAVSQLWDASVLLKAMDFRRHQKQKLQRDLSSLGRGEQLGKTVRKNMGKTLRGLLNPSKAVGLMDKDAHIKRKRKILIASIAAFLFWVVIGTIANAFMQDLPNDDSEGSHLIRGFYFSVITLTTVGFGDFVPRTTAGKVFDIFYILFGVPISVNALGKVVRSVLGEDAEEQSVDLVKGLNEKKLRSMLDFQVDMSNAGCGNEVDGQVSRYEFMMFVLVRNGIVEMDTVKAIMHNFDELDVARTDALEAVDLQVGLSPSQSEDEGEGENGPAQVQEDGSAEGQEA